MQTSMSSLQQLFGAFIDIFLMPFIPLIIPVLKTLVDMLPKWKEWVDKFAELLGQGKWREALEMAGKGLLTLVQTAFKELLKLFGKETY